MTKTAPGRVEPAGWGGPTLWFQQVPEAKLANNRQHFDLRAIRSVESKVQRLIALGARILGEHGDLVVMADPEANGFFVET